MNVFITHHAVDRAKQRCNKPHRQPWRRWLRTTVARAIRDAEPELFIRTSHGTVHLEYRNLNLIIGVNGEGPVLVTLW